MCTCILFKVSFLIDKLVKYCVMRCFETVATVATGRIPYAVCYWFEKYDTTIYFNFHQMYVLISTQSIKNHVFVEPAFWATFPHLISTIPCTVIIIIHFISLEPAFWATLPLYSTVDCTVGGSKESRCCIVVQSPHCAYGCTVAILLLLTVAMFVHLHHGLLSVLSAC
jgi:hypothetical protein